MRAKDFGVSGIGIGISGSTSKKIVNANNHHFKACWSVCRLFFELICWKIQVSKQANVKNLVIHPEC